MAARLKNLRISKVDLVDKGAAIGARVTLYKRHVAADSGGATLRKGDTMDLESILASLPEEQRKVIEAALAAKAEADAAAMKADEPAAESAVKRLPAEVREIVESQQAELRKRLDEASKRVAQLEDESLSRELVAKSARFARGAIGIAQADLVAILKSIAKGEPLSAKHGEMIEKHFVSVESLVCGSDMLREIGSSSPSPGSAREQLSAIAKRLRETNPEISEAAAIDRAAKANPSLYAAARKEERS
jgi:hypothetical protein